jgi:hypothetical protein
MNILNKIVVILLLLAAMVLTPLLLIFPEQAEVAVRYAADVIKANLDWLNTQSSGAQIGIRLLLALGGMLAFLVGMVLLVLEIFPVRRKTVRLQDNSGELMLDSITGHLSYHLDLLPDVLRVRPQIRSRGKAVRATIHIETPPDVNVPQKSAEVKETTRQVLQEQLGLQAKEIRVVVRPVDYPKLSTSERKRPMRAERPIAPPISPVEPTVVEDQEAEPLSPRQEERPYLDDSYLPPAQAEQLESIPPQISEETDAVPPALAKTASPDLAVYKTDASEREEKAQNEEKDPNQDSL